MVPFVSLRCSCLRSSLDSILCSASFSFTLCTRNVVKRRMCRGRLAWCCWTARSWSWTATSRRCVKTSSTWWSRTLGWWSTISSAWHTSEVLRAAVPYMWCNIILNILLFLKYEVSCCVVLDIFLLVVIAYINGVFINGIPSLAKTEEAAGE